MHANLLTMKFLKGSFCKLSILLYPHNWHFSFELPTLPLRNYVGTFFFQKWFILSPKLLSWQHFEHLNCQLVILIMVSRMPFNRFWVSIAKDFLAITYFWRFSILIVLKTELLPSRTNFMMLMLFKIMFLISWINLNLDVCSNFRSHSDGVTCLQFNDFYIVSGSYDKTVKLWDFTVC